ncbi:hypothetical protein [Nocardia sp. SC052]|uniref:hypothetical protein n=1 Tax=Nocardia sichangensis TaxID=3385975 RepID=UPI00399FCEE8
MAKTNRPNYRRQAQGKQRRTRRHGEITVRSVKRTPPDLRKLSRAVIALAMAEARAHEEATELSVAEQSPASNEAASPEVSHDD